MKFTLPDPIPDAMDNLQAGNLYLGKPLTPPHPKPNQALKTLLKDLYFTLQNKPTTTKVILQLSYKISYLLPVYATSKLFMI